MQLSSFIPRPSVTVQVQGRRAVASWGPAGAADEYTVYYYAEPGPPHRPVRMLKTSAHQVTLQLPPGDYGLYVVASGQAGRSAPSNEARFSVRSAARTRSGLGYLLTDAAPAGAPTGFPLLLGVAGLWLFLSRRAHQR
jgi:hypothetical protein